MNTITLEIRERKTINMRTPKSPPKGFVTGDEFEKRVKERVTKFYEENGLL